MSLPRCLKQHSPPQGRTKSYVGYANPLGYPDTAVRCVHDGEPAVVWLTSDEVARYIAGERIFGGDTGVAKVKVDDSGITHLPREKAE